MVSPWLHLGQLLADIELYPLEYKPATVRSSHHFHIWARKIVSKQSPRNTKLKQWFQKEDDLNFLLTAVLRYSGLGLTFKDQNYLQSPVENTEFVHF